jgi:hypothetical protein
MVVAFDYYACYMEIEPKKVNHDPSFPTPYMHMQ